jgi:hypothetical protein
MLILGVQRLVVFETPKTASLALRAMLAGHALPQSYRVARHIGQSTYQLKHAGNLAQAFGGGLETVAVVRAPLERMKSWYRYRKRAQVAHLPISTRGMSFEAFMLAYLEDHGPEMVNVGRQDWFLSWTGAQAQVDHVFDYARLDLLVGFLSACIGEKLVLPRRNISPRRKSTCYALSDAVLARYRAANAEEFAFYRAVSAQGHLRRAVLAKAA